MGAGLVMAAYDVAARLQLDHAPARVFVYMAASALDSDPNPAFWRGRDALSLAIGNSGAAGYRAVTRALEPLVARGAIVLVKRPAPAGRNARYALMDGSGNPLRVIHNAGRSPSRDDATEDGQRPVNGGRSAPERRTVSAGTEDGERPPEEEKEDKEDSGAHVHEPNAVAALTRIRDDRHLPLPVAELLTYAYRIGRGDPWRGYTFIRDMTEKSLEWADNPTAALRSKLERAIA